MSPTPINVTLVEPTGKSRECAFALREAEPVNRIIAKLKELFVAEDALIEEAWWVIVHTLVAFDRICAQLRTEPNWLLG